MGLVPLLALCPALIFATALSAAEPSFRVLPAPVDRGTPARVLAEGLGPEDGLSGAFDGRPVFFFPLGPRLVGLFGVDILTSPGHYPLALTWTGGHKEIDIMVRDRSYGERVRPASRYQRKFSREELARLDREKKTAREAQAAASPERLWTGAWASPSSGTDRVISAFGRQTRPEGGASDPEPHLGTDYAALLGSPVKAPADGLVLLADFQLEDGGVIYIDHGLGLVSCYANLSELRVTPGDRVRRGDLLGLAGATGRYEGSAFTMRFF
jgi:hypothetical protein